jgi:hypothetical protein
MLIDKIKIKFLCQLSVEKSLINLIETDIATSSDELCGAVERRTDTMH